MAENFVDEKQDATMRNAFIVKDPKTYVNAEEAWFKYSGRKKGAYLFIITPKGDPNNVVGTLSQVIDPDKWKKIIWFKSWSNNPKKKSKKRRNKLYRRFCELREYLYNKIDKIKLDSIARKYRPCENVFSGHRNTQEHLAASLDPKNLYLMDSGMMILDKIQPSGYIDYSYRYQDSRVQKYLYKFVGFKVHDRSKTTFFTAYKNTVNTHHPVEENQHQYKRKLIQEKEVGKYALLISSPIYQMTKGVTLQSYIEYLKKVFETFDLTGRDIVYIPHPTREDQESINTVKHALGCRVDDRLIPIEVKIAKYDTLPKLCISPCSSSIVNIAAVSNGRFRICSAWHKEFNCFKFLTDWKNNVVDNTSINIEFIDIPDAVPMFNIDQNLCENGPVYDNYRDWYTKNHP